MSESKNQEKFDAAVDLELLNDRQLDTIKREQQHSNYPPLEIAIRKGFLNRRQLDLLAIFADPLSVVPGYRIDGFLGQGGAGTVYKATQLRMDRPVAIKTISPSIARNDLTPKRFEREAKIVGRLRHPNIISAFDFGIHNQQLYLVMEFVDGIDAEKVLAQNIPVPEIHAWHVAHQVCHALENAKQHDVIHRDIKPGNLILTTAPSGTQHPANVPFVKVADFGLAKFNDNQLDATITLDNAISGTPFYMSPEQIKSQQIDHRSDIYSLGSTIWHLITGVPPVTGTSPLDVITTKMKLEDKWLSEKPDNISNAGFQLIKKMCRHDRQQRIDDYSTLNQEIESVIQRLKQNSTRDSTDFELIELPYSVKAKVTTIQELAKTFITDGDSDFDNNFDSDSIAIRGTRNFVSDEAETGDSSALLQQPDHGTGLSTRNIGLPLVIAMVTALVLIAIYLLFPAGQQSYPTQKTSESTPSSSDQQAGPPATLDEFVGPPMMLFNGRSMDPTQKSSGTWEPAEGAEGGAILSGIGSRNFRCQDSDRKPLGHFRFVCGFRHHKADKIGFRLLNQTEDDESEKVLWEVEIEREKATLKQGETISETPIQQFDDEQTFGYHQFRLDSQPDHWRVEIDGQLLDAVEKSNEGPLGDQSVQILVTGEGPAHFETLHFRTFKSQ